MLKGGLLGSDRDMVVIELVWKHCSNKILTVKNELVLLNRWDMYSCTFVSQKLQASENVRIVSKKRDTRCAPCTM